RFGIPCAVISSPVHVQDFPARYSPQMGFEGANVIFDTWIHPLVMGLEEHLLTMFREDFEFHDAAGASHHGGKATAAIAVPEEQEASGGDILAEMKAEAELASGEVMWLAAAERELKKIPFFVRGKAKRNTEKYALDKGVLQISVETLYEAKAHYAR
ncbi:MAG: ferredoxin:protochlorophyllide reductase (ATP-dependent) subunit B, partial [Rhodoferax sp.]|nr:ferredoxin:protochlorophyllide reductase (ATP-dependent) subunit B [Pseudorhodobacter sp.]